MFTRINRILIKEFIQLWRDKWGRFRLIVPPIIQLLLFGYAATFDVNHAGDGGARPRPQPGKPRAHRPLHLEQPLEYRRDRPLAE